jgi:hypothetical protein
MPIACKVRQASILSCTRRSAAKSGTTVATSSRLRCADRTATCSCVGSSTSMARSLAMRFAASNQAIGSSAKRGTRCSART